MPIDKLSMEVKFALATIGMLDAVIASLIVVEQKLNRELSKVEVEYYTMGYVDSSNQILDYVAMQQEHQRMAMANTGGIIN